MASELCRVERTVEAQGLRHAVRSEHHGLRQGASTRCHTKCGGYVDDVCADVGALMVTCVRCLVLTLRQHLCPWCKPPGSGVDTCEVNGRCMSCDGTGVADDEGEA